jgi:hypothetical protein
LLLAAPPGNFYHPTREEAFYHGALWGFLSFDPACAAAGDLPPPPPLSFFPDTGLVHYRDDAVGVTLSLRCGPWLGYHGYRQAQGPSDRLGLAPGAGHFIVAIAGRPLLTTPDSGYRLHSALRSCLLIDGKGQRDDIGYPMSIPSKRHAGEEIQFARWDAATGIGWIRLNLAPVYPDDAGVVAYTRDFHVAAGQKQIVCRDAVVLRDPKPLSWLFQGKEETGLTCAGTRCQFGRSPVLMLEARPTGCELRSRIARTEVVWAYASSSGFKPFCHARFDCIAPVATATVDFVLTW